MTATALVKPALNVSAIFPVGVEGDAIGNQIVDRASLFREIRKLAGIMANGQQSRTKAAYLFSAAARLGIVHVGKNKSAAGDDAEKAYLELATAHNARGKGAADFDDLPADAKAAKSAISNFRTFGQPAVLNQGEEFFPLVCRIARELGTDCKLSPYMAMVRANVQVERAQAKMIGKRMFIADADDIAGWLRNKETAKDDPAVALDKAMKALTELSQEHDFGQDVEDAMTALLKKANAFISDYTQAHAG